MIKTTTILAILIMFFAINTAKLQTNTEKKDSIKTLLTIKIDNKVTLSKFNIVEKTVLDGKTYKTVMTSNIPKYWKSPFSFIEATFKQQEDSVEYDETESGIASWYGPGFQGRKTANGERYDMYEYTAAHKELPFNTKVKVVNQNNGKWVVVRINDRGPYVRGRVIDLSKSAMNDIAGSDGLVKVKLYIIKNK